MIARILLSSFLVAVVISCGNGAPDSRTKGKQPFFVLVSATKGLVFEHSVVASPDRVLPEIMGSGAAVFDANGDGHLDIYFCDAKERGKPSPNRLFLGGPGGNFRQVKGALGLDDPGYSMGCSVGDIDADGDLDIHVANWGPDHLYINEGGKFRRADVSFPDVWTSTSALADFDRDGDLDLYCVHYVVVDPLRKCEAINGRPDYCSPKVFKGVADAIWENQGTRGFVDRSARSAISSLERNGLGIIVDDFNFDGQPDIYIANDGEANSLWIQTGPFRFEDQAFSMGCAMNGRGVAEASMGTAFDDVDGDGRRDLFMTHLAGESHTLYRQLDDGNFSDATSRSGLHAASLRETGFGTILFDLDLDGDLDLASANGGVQSGTAPKTTRLSKTWSPYAQANSILLNDGQGTFSALEHDELFAVSPMISRGLIPFDMDDDGDLDLLITNCAGPARLYENRHPHQGRHMSLELVAPVVEGSEVVVTVGERSYRRRMRTAGSYQSSWSTALHFGLGPAENYDAIRVTWPDGHVEIFEGGKTGLRIQLRRGQGRKP